MGEYCVAFFDVTGPWASVFSDEFPDYIENINKQILPDNSAIIKNEGRGFIQNCISLLMGCVEILLLQAYGSALLDGHDCTFLCTL